MASFTRAEIRNILGEAHTDDIENRLIALHLGVVDPLKDNLATYKATADKLPAVQKELDDLKAANDGGYKEKYEAEVKAHKEYKQKVEAEKVTARDDADVYSMCKEAGISRESALRMISKEIDRSKIKRGDDGEITNRDELVKSIQTEYVEYVGTSQDSGTPTVTPPTGAVGSMTRDQILNIKDAHVRQQAIADNMHLFTK